MLKLEKSVQTPAVRGHVILWSWIWRAALVASLLWAYAGSRYAERAAPAEIFVLEPPPTCVVRLLAHDGEQVFKFLHAPAELCWVR